MVHLQSQTSCSCKHIPSFISPISWTAMVMKLPQECLEGDQLALSRLLSTYLSFALHDLQWCSQMTFFNFFFLPSPSSSDQLRFSVFYYLHNHLLFELKLSKRNCRRLLVNSKISHSARHDRLERGRDGDGGGEESKRGLEFYYLKTKNPWPAQLRIRSRHWIFRSTWTSAFALCVCFFL